MQNLDCSNDDEIIGAEAMIRVRILYETVDKKFVGIEVILEDNGYSACIEVPTAYIIGKIVKYNEH